MAVVLLNLGQNICKCMGYLCCVMGLTIAPREGGYASFSRVNIFFLYKTKQTFFPIVDESTRQNKFVFSMLNTYQIMTKATACNSTLTKTVLMDSHAQTLAHTLMLMDSHL